MVWDLTAECIAAIIVCIIIVYSKEDNMVPSLKNKVFQGCLLITFCSIVTNIISTLMIYNYTVVPMVLIWLVTMVYFMATPLMGVMFLFYTAAIVLEEKPLVAKRIMLIFGIPFFFYMGVVLTNPWTKLLFDLDHITGYSRGEWISSTYVIFYIYCLLCLLVVIWKRKEVDRSIGRILVAFPVIAILVIFAQQILVDSILTGTAASFALLIIYLYFQNKQITMDILTGTANRQAFLKVLELKLKQPKNWHGTLIVVSLKDFKRTNDNFGQHNGDELLVKISTFLKATVRYSQLYRYSGDEFVIILENEPMRMVEKVIAQIEARFALPWQVGIYSCHLRAAIGVASIPEVLDNVGDIINGIEYGVSQAKAQGCVSAVFCTKDMLNDIKRKNAIAKILREVLEQKALTVYLQPIWSTHKNRFVGAEALSRLEDPILGFIPPDEFIAIAEETGLIIDLGYQVLEKVCAFMESYLDLGKGIENISVNLSAVQFSQADLAKRLKDIIEGYHLPLDKIKFELTESLVVNNYEAVKGLMSEMQAEGVQFAMDDFGTGYSNIASVIDLPFDTIKFDKSLVWASVENERSSILVGGMTRIIKEIGISVLSEGIEDEPQRKMVTDWGCELIQGYYYAKPLTMAQALPLLLNQVR